MRTFKNQAAQGDLLLRRVDALPTDGLVEQRTSNGMHVVAHSETGHHHHMAAKGVRYFHSPDPLVSFLEVIGDEAVLRHARDFDTHDPIAVPPGVYELRRQREWVPEGWRQVMD